MHLKCTVASDLTEIKYEFIPMRVIQPRLGAGYNRGFNSNERVREHFSER